MIPPSTAGPAASHLETVPTPQDRAFLAAEMRQAAVSVHTSPLLASAIAAHLQACLLEEARTVELVGVGRPDRMTGRMLSIARIINEAAS